MRISSVGEASAKAVDRANANAEHAVSISRCPSDHGACCGCPRRRWWLLAAAIVVIVVVISIVAATAWDSGTSGNHYSYQGSERHALASRDHLDIPGIVIVPRANWSHQPAADLPRLGHPTPFVVVKHTAGPECVGMVQCGHYLRDVRELHWQRYQQPEISYNFLVDSVGNIYEGRGWDAVNVNKGRVYNCNVDVALIGNYVEHGVPDAMARALQQLLDHGVAGGQLAPDYRLLAHNQVSNTISPGRQALEAIKDWPHRCLSHCDDGIQCPVP